MYPPIPTSHPRHLWADQGKEGKEMQVAETLCISHRNIQAQLVCIYPGTTKLIQSYNCGFYLCPCLNKAVDGGTWTELSKQSVRNVAKRIDDQPGDPPNV